jgi:hypothetical protein
LDEATLQAIAEPLPFVIGLLLSSGPHLLKALAFSRFPAENDYMVIRGRIHDGVVTLGNEISLPEGMEVTVVVPVAPESGNEVLPEGEHQRILQVMDRIAALPIEGDTDPFSGADHDKLLYGSP